MPQVTLHKVDGKLSLVFDTGDHVLGRGAKFMCDSKKVSRNHGILKIDNAGVFLHSTHNNPCFLRQKETIHISIITFGNSVQIYNGDKISLLLDHGWFKVQIQAENVQNATETVTENPQTSLTLDENRKRPIDNCELIINKKIKIENPVIPESEIKLEPAEVSDECTLNRFETTENLENDETRQLEFQPTETSSEHLQNVVELPEITQQTEEVPKVIEFVLNQDAIPEILPQVGEASVLPPEIVQQAETTASTSGIEIKTEPIDEPNEVEANNLNIDKVLIKTEIEEDKGSGDENGSKVKEEDKPSTSGTNNRVWRDRCWYGKTCYRKNAGHRAEFRHFDDSDYDSDANDSRPICCYGAVCYRKNAEHRRKYRHPGQDRLPQKPNQPQQPKTRPKRRKAKAKKQATPDYDDLDSDEESDPYLDGASSDDYAPTDHSDTESDTDQEDNTQDIEKEARKLVKHMRKQK